MTAEEASKIILNIVEFLGSPISVLRFRPSEFHVQLDTLHFSGFCAPPDLKRGLNFLLCHPKIDFLRDCQILILKIRRVCLRLKFSPSLNSNKLSCLWTDTNLSSKPNKYFLCPITIPIKAWKQVKTHPNQERSDFLSIGKRPGLSSKTRQAGIERFYSKLYN